MSSTQLALGHAGTVLVAAALVGLLVRGRWRLWYAFTVSLFIVSVHDSLIATWPSRFHRGSIWWAKEATLVLVRFFMVVELTIRVFRHFPAAFATARHLLVFILVVTFVAVAALPTREVGYLGFVGALMPRILNGTVWLFAAVTALILWYRLPLDWFRKAILLSYVPYLLASTVLLNALAAAGWQRGWWFNVLLQVAYVLLLLFWTYSAWRRDPSRPTPAQRHEEPPPA
jgi:hypothetical protein